MTNSLIGACGQTTVPISRPSSTAPAVSPGGRSAKRRWNDSRAARTAGHRRHPRGRAGSNVAAQIGPRQVGLAQRLGCPRRISRLETVGPAQRLHADGTVEQTGVEIGVAQMRCKAAGERALAGGGRAVDGDDVSVGRLPVLPPLPQASRRAGTLLASCAQTMVTKKIRARADDDHREVAGLTMVEDARHLQEADEPGRIDQHPGEAAAHEAAIDQAGQAAEQQPEDEAAGDAVVDERHEDAGRVVEFLRRVPVEPARLLQHVQAQHPAEKRLADLQREAPEPVGSVQRPEDAAPVAHQAGAVVERGDVVAGQPGQDEHEEAVVLGLVVCRPGAEILEGREEGEEPDEAEERRQRGEPRKARLAQEQDRQRHHELDDGDALAPDEVAHQGQEEHDAQRRLLQPRRLRARHVEPAQHQQGDVRQAAPAPAWSRREWCRWCRGFATRPSARRERRSGSKGSRATGMNQMA